MCLCAGARLHVHVDTCWTIHNKQSVFLASPLLFKVARQTK